ncbi:MlaD family protein [Nocardia vaccinii]|uniref:MlaD family protein n=1 Tax=Nocardia vaccinii TaxID=1822 RepID=UPI0009FF16E0|nr:MlaD family protein [Nocardia vaccinii]
MRNTLRPSHFRAVKRGGSERGRDLRWGIAGIGGALVLVAAIGVLDIVGTTPERTYTADLTEAGSVRTGDDVRIAGIPVGKVTSLTLLRDRVRMAFTVRDNVFLGDQTTLGVRMLTIVGGYYLAVEPAGTQPLGSKVIPAQRVILPYNLTQAFQDAVTPVQHTDGNVVRQDLAALTTSVNASPDSLRSAIHAVGDLVGIMDRQNADISHTLSLADEYLTALNANSDVLAQLLTTLRTLEVLVANNRDQISDALHGLAEVLQDFSPLGRAWDASLKQRAQPLADAIPKLRELGGRMNTLLDSLRTLEQRLVPFTESGKGVTVDQSAATTSDVCVPIPGGGC